MISLLVISLLSVIRALSIARRGSEDGVRDMPFIKSMQAQFEVFGKVRKSIKISLEQNRGQYEELADRIEELNAGDAESE